VRRFERILARMKAEEGNAPGTGASGNATGEAPRS